MFGIVQRYICAFLFCAIFLAACDTGSEAEKHGQQETKNEPAPYTPGTLQTETGQPSTLPEIEQPDYDRPLSEFEEIRSGNQLMMHHLALSGIPPDYSAIAEHYSAEYARTRDSFRRRDLLQAIQPRIKADLERAQENPYVLWRQQGSDVIGHYDFNAAGFPVRVGLFKPRRYSYYPDNRRYRLSIVNGPDYKFVPVSDEVLAQEIEGQLGKQKFTVEAYLFLRSTDIRQETVQGELMRVRLLDDDDQVLADYGPTSELDNQK